MSSALLGLLSTPTGAQHVVVYESRQVFIFLTAYSTEGAAIPLFADLNRWIVQQAEIGVECASLLLSCPMAVLVCQRIERLANLARPRLEMRGFAPQPWAGLLQILKAQLDGDPSAPKLPAGYAFRPAPRIETAPESIAC